MFLEQAPGSPASSQKTAWNTQKSRVERITLQLDHSLLVVFLVLKQVDRMLHLAAANKVFGPRKAPVTRLPDAG